MKILFLDIDGVVNCAKSAGKYMWRGCIGIDPYKALLVDRIIEATGCKVVLSSTWRLREEDREQVRQQVCKFIDITPHMPLPGGAEACERGKEIKDWLDRHPEVEKYAILDDDNDMLPEQQVNFFKTGWWTDGLTEEITKNVIAHFTS